MDVVQNPFRISEHGNLDGFFSSVLLAVNLGVVTFSMIEGLVVGVQEESRLIPQLNYQEFTISRARSLTCLIYHD